MVSFEATGVVPAEELNLNSKVGQIKNRLVLGLGMETDYQQV